MTSRAEIDFVKLVTTLTSSLASLPGLSFIVLPPTAHRSAILSQEAVVP
jgi:hypothetical protein